MKKNIATLLRRVAQWLDPQKGDITGYARKVIGFIPYIGIDNYRALMMSGAANAAQTTKGRIRSLAEITALADLSEKLVDRSMIRLEHNFGTHEKEVNGIKCPAEGLTIILELKGTWS